MGSYGGEPRAWRRAGSEAPTDGRIPAGVAVPGSLTRVGPRSAGLPGPVPTAVSEALSELRQLAGHPLPADVERALADLGRASDGAGFDVDTVRQLRRCSAEYQRVAIDLEAAARCCRLVEREINQRADALLSEKNRGVGGQLLDIFRRGRGGVRNAAPGPELFPPPQAQAQLQSPPQLQSQLESEPAPAAASPDADIAASALGPLEVHVAGRRVPRWTSLKARAVFQYLLIHQDRPIRRDVLMSLQWPDHSHNSARNNLNVALYSLRNTLDGLGHGAQPVLYRDGCYILNPELTWWIDRNEFLAAVDDAQQAHRERRPEQVIGAYRKAIGLYRGPLFEDDGDGDWYLPEQRRLQDLYGQALEGIAEIHFRLGELADAQRFASLALGHDPCSESSHRLLMRCYASQHKQQLVGRQYQVCVAALRDELGVTPSDETVKLFRELT
jgi:DNA-binding SARP family transcriptional activator